MSQRVSELTESATLAVASRAAELRARGVDVVDWSAGEPDFKSPAGAVAAAIKALEQGRTRYTSNTGIAELRSVIAHDLAQRLGGPWAADQVVVTVGAKAALFELALALFGPGDEVVLPNPYWVTFPAQIKLAGAEVVEVKARPENGFRISADQVRQGLSARTRAVLLNSPSNPTGAVIAAADLRAIVEECAARDVYLLADETYERFVYDSEPFPSAATLARAYPKTVILIGSFSKTHAMTGWRLGYLAGPETVVKAVAKIQSHATSNATTFAMWGALAAFDDAEERVARMLGEYQARRDLLLAGLAGIPGVDCPVPGGAFYAFPKVSALYRTGRRGSLEFAEFLLDEARVAVVPGAAFGDDDHVRISFACSSERLSEGIDRLTKALT
ncbi:MAG: pyridoxal phosphate-dependent aminotransferase [Acidobacteriota bacterium]|nr:pyridoxal phosphate-dependent aminotransferase [Acidobacteriota bacterium]